jgi:hypothetical protein
LRFAKSNGSSAIELMAEAVPEPGEKDRSLKLARALETSPGGKTTMEPICGWPTVVLQSFKAKTVWNDIPTEGDVIVTPSTTATTGEVTGEVVTVAFLAVALLGRDDAVVSGQ